jgi:hypothetical protein
MKDQAPTPGKIAALANEEADLDRTALIGVFGNVSDPGALIRKPSGSVLKVKVGDHVDGGTVRAIGNDHLILARGEKTTVLRLPQS